MSHTSHIVLQVLLGTKIYKRNHAFTLFSRAKMLNFGSTTSCSAGSPQKRIKWQIMFGSCTAIHRHDTSWRDEMCKYLMCIQKHTS